MSSSFPMRLMPQHWPPPSVGLVIPTTLGPFHGLAESSAGPAPMDLDALVPTACPPPPMHAPPAATSHQPPPQPTRSSRQPPPPIPQAQKRSYADTARNTASLVAFTRTLPDLNPERIIAAHQAALSTALSAKHQLHTTTAGPSRSFLFQ
jgi:hypothetical protein